MRRLLTTLYILTLLAFQSVMAQQLPPPGHVSVEKGKEAGSVEIKWKSVKGALDYTVQYSYNESNCWLEAGSTEGHSLVIKGLKPGRKYYFRVQGHKGSEMGRWCPSIVQYATAQNGLAELIKDVALEEDIK